jgi:predicted lactoylglutathione lyase
MSQAGSLITRTDFVFMPITSFARSELEAHGVKFNGETMDSGVCYQAFFEDPDGNALILHPRYAPPGVKPKS